MPSPADDHAEGLARLGASIAALLGRPRPITTFPCAPFVPDHEMGPKDETCPVCRRPRRYREPLPPDRSDGLVCGGCHRGSIRVDLACESQRRRDRDREDLRRHNLNLTKDSPRPAILDEPPPEPEPAAKPARKRKPRAKQPA